MDEDNEQVDGQPQQQVALEDIQAELDTAMSGWRRAAADFENYKRRQQQEAVELVDFTRGDTFKRIMPVLDSLEQALRHMPRVDDQNISASVDQFVGQYTNWQNGVNGIVAQLDKTLAEMGVKKIEAVGKKFDPNFHEAIRETEGPEDGIVTEELQTGYELNGKLIRPSQVVISKKVG